MVESEGVDGVWRRLGCSKRRYRPKENLGLPAEVCLVCRGL